MIDGRREQRKAQTRQALIDAGIRLMHERGYDAVSTTQIARAAGVAPATLFNYFPTKASIVFADADLWRPPGAVTPGATPRQTMRALLLAMVDQPGWTRPADDPLTLLRFELVRREPALAEAQLALAFAQVPVWAALVRDAHPDLGLAAALAEAGAVIGAVMAALTWTDVADLRTAVGGAIDRLG